MRNFKNLFLAVAIILTASTTYANINPTINLQEAKVLVVDLNDWAKADLKISIKDENNEVLLDDQLNAGQLTSRKYNLKNLPIGNYTLIIAGSQKVAVHSIDVSNNSVVINNQDVEVYFRPTLTVKEGAVELNHLALGKKVQVSISDQRGVFFVKEYKDMGSVNKRFDTSTLPKGSYVVSVSTKNQYVSKSFDK